MGLHIITYNAWYPVLSFLFFTLSTPKHITKKHDEISNPCQNISDVGPNSNNHSPSSTSNRAMQNTWSRTCGTNKQDHRNVDKRLGYILFYTSSKHPHPSRFLMYKNMIY